MSGSSGKPGSARRFFALARGERTLLLHAAVMVLVVRLALWWVPSRVVLRRVASYVGRTADRPKAGMPPQRVGWAVRVASRLVPRASCLTQALAAQILLAKHGHDSRLHLGVAREEPAGFRAHAWVESEGEIVVGGEELATYTVLPDVGQAL